MTSPASSRLIELQIRRETPADIPAIHEVNIAAFRRPGAPILEADMADALRAHGKAILSLVAELDGLVIGHVMFSPVRFEPSQPPMTGIALGPLTVSPEHQRGRIGGTLVRAGLEEVRARGYGSVFLYGNPKYYERFGFQAARVFGIACPGPNPLMDAFQAIELRPGALQGTSGMAYEAEELA